MKKWINSIKKNLDYKECNLEEITTGNPSLQKSGMYSKKRNQFFKELDNKSIKELVKKYCKNNRIYKRVLAKIKKIIKNIIFIKKITIFWSFKL